MLQHGEQVGNQLPGLAGRGCMELWRLRAFQVGPRQITQTGSIHLVIGSSEGSRIAQLTQESALVLMCGDYYTPHPVADVVYCGLRVSLEVMRLILEAR